MIMKIIRFIFPFLFVRNWYTGSWEVSRTRMVFFVTVVALFLLGLLAAFILQLPVEYDVAPKDSTS